MEKDQAVLSCPIARTVEMIGDKWTLLILRDLFFLEKSTFKELSQSPERIPTNTLTDRLRKLEAAGVIMREAYQERPVRYAYRLTKKGSALGPVLYALALHGFGGDEAQLKRWFANEWDLALRPRQAAPDVLERPDDQDKVA